jgi:hypothetical protein
VRGGNSIGKATRFLIITLKFKVKSGPKKEEKQLKELTPTTTYSLPPYISPTLDTRKMNWTNSAQTSLPFWPAS